MAFGVSDAELMAQLEAMRDLPDEELDALFTDQTEELSDGHLVEYIEESVKHTERVEEKRMRLDEQLWQAHEGEMPEMSLKDDWQAKITTNEPFQTVTQAKMLVKKAIINQPEWFDVTTEHTDNPSAVEKAAFWKDALRFWAKRSKMQHFVPDMTEMGFSVGISMGMKAIWSTDEYGNEGLRIGKILPWQLRSDPDRISREPQSGLYCIHQDWVDYHVLLEGEKKGFYENVRDCLRDKGDEGTWDRRNERKRRGLVDYTHRFRPQVFVREFWGGVLDHNGELIYPNVRMTVANRTIIKRPVPTKFARIRWPIHQFSPLSHVRNFHGYGLIDGMLKMWKFRCNILSMTADRLNFVLNGAWEVDESKLVNPADKELYPGCTKAKKMNANGPAYTAIRQDTDFLPVFQTMMEQTGNLYQNGVFVTELVKGEMGERSNVTRGEIEIKTQQALGVFEGIGRDVEYGVEQGIEMIQDVLTTYWDPWDKPGYEALGMKHARILGVVSTMSPDQRIEALRQETDIEVRGVSLLLQKSGLVDRLINMIKVTDSPRFHPFAKDDVLIHDLASAMDSAKGIKTDEEMQNEQMAAMQQAAMAGVAVPHGTPGQVEPGGQVNSMVDQALQVAGVGDA